MPDHFIGSCTLCSGISYVRSISTNGNRLNICPACYSSHNKLMSCDYCFMTDSGDISLRPIIATGNRTFHVCSICRQDVEKYPYSPQGDSPFEYMLAHPQGRTEHHTVSLLNQLTEDEQMAIAEKVNHKKPVIKVEEFAKLILNWKKLDEAKEVYLGPYHRDIYEDEPLTDDDVNYFRFIMDQCSISFDERPDGAGGLVAFINSNTVDATNRVILELWRSVNLESPDVVQQFFKSKELIVSEPL